MMDIEHNFCLRCGRRTAVGSIHTCTPPEIDAVEILRAALIRVTECDDSTKRQGMAAHTLRATAGIRSVPAQMGTERAKSPYVLGVKPSDLAEQIAAGNLEDDRKEREE